MNRPAGRTSTTTPPGPPGAAPVKPGGLTSFSSCFVNAGLLARGMFEVKPTWLSLPSPS